MYIDIILIYIYIYTYIYYLVIQPLNIIEDKDFLPCHECGENEELKECAECMDNFCSKCFISHIKDKHVHTYICIYYIYKCRYRIYIDI